MKKQPFLRFDYKGPLRRDWLLFEKDQGCVFVQGDLCLQMDKQPPPLPHAAKEVVSKPAVAAVASVALHAVPPKKDAAVVFLEWMIARGEKKQANAQVKPEPKLPKPFDLYDIPAALRAAGFSVAAKLAQKWLDSAAYTAYGTDEPGNAQEGRYPEDKVDLSTISLSWLRDQPKLEKRYQALLTQLASPNALRELSKNFVKYLSNYLGLSHELNTREHCQGDWQTVHELFQFQLESVGMLDTLTDSLGMTDVTAALANFNFYAAVARANVKTEVYNVYNTPMGTRYCRKSMVEITHVWVYAKDSYSFHDSGASSQYLGHWNKHGVIVLPAAVAASVGMKMVADTTHTVRAKPLDSVVLKLLERINDQNVELWNDEVARFPVDIGGSLLEKDVYYPVRNRNYRDWRAKHNRGGDFLLLTEPKLVRLDQPIVLDMPEVCK